MRNAWALAVTCVAALMFGLEISSVPVILPTLGKALRADFVDLQWVMNAYTIVCTAVSMAVGTLADRFGRRRIFVVSLSVFGVASLACGMAGSIATLIASRAAQGLGGGAMLICLSAIIAHRFREGAERAKAFSIWGIVFGAGLGLGPVVGGLIAALAGWRWVFLIHVPITAVTLAAVGATIRESRETQPRALDVPGIALLSLAVLGLSSCLMEGPSLGFGSPLILGMAAVTAASAGGFVWFERRSEHPMFDLSIWRERRFSGAILGSAGINFSFWPLMIYLPIYFQNGLGYDHSTTGLVLLGYTLPVLALPPLGEYLALRYQAGRVIPLGLAITAVGCVLIACGSAMHAPSGLSLLPGCLLAGAGVGLANISITNMATGAVPPGRTGMASGIDMTVRLVTLAANIACMGILLLAGVRSVLARALVGSPGTVDVSALAQRLVADGVGPGGIAAGATHLDAAVLHAALQHGFFVVTLYAGTGALLFATLAYSVLRSASWRTRAPAEGHTERSRRDGAVRLIRRTNPP
jgi:EmrB/QacA subfamily drug resistance transporter